MKIILIIILFLVSLSQYLKADKIKIKEPEILHQYNIDRHNVYIICLDGYKYILTSVSGGTNITQMFKESSSASRTIPVDCYR